MNIAADLGTPPTEPEQCSRDRFLVKSSLLESCRQQSAYLSEDSAGARG